jgi:hypothetical protein
VFDLTRPAHRALARKVEGGSIPFRLTARSADGRIATVPPGSGRLRIFVTSEMPSLRLEQIPVEQPRTVVALRLPWGTGPRRAGLAPGDEAATVGPSGFDVDARGRIYLLDAGQDRIGVFSSTGALRRSIRVDAGPTSDVALGGGGTIHLASQTDGTVRTESLTRTGRVLTRRTFEGAFLGGIRASGRGPFVHLLPEDVWVPASRATGAPRAGLAIGDRGTLLQSRVGNGVRLALVRAGEVRSAFEIDSSEPLGDLALGARLAGGFVAVVRRLEPGGGSSYEVVRLGSDGAGTRFQVPADEYADQLPWSRVRLGRDGNLYQLRTFPDGLAIVRYEMGEGR